MEAIENMLIVLRFCQKKYLLACVSHCSEATINMISITEEYKLQQKGEYLSFFLTVMKNLYPGNVALIFGYEYTVETLKNVPQRQSRNPILSIQTLRAHYTSFRKERLFYVRKIEKFADPLSPNIRKYQRRIDRDALTFSLTEFAIDDGSISSQEESQPQPKPILKKLTPAEYSEWRAREATMLENFMTSTKKCESINL